MLLLTNILRSRYRGVIHLYPDDADSPPEIEFSGGEGPEQGMNQIQDVAVPEIRKHVEPLGPFLRWEELDFEAGVVRRHRTSFGDRLEFVLCPDELGIELVLPADGVETGEPGDGPRPWVPLRPLGEPGPEQLAAIGWTVTEPELTWRYVKTRYRSLALEMTWSCGDLPGSWAARVLADAGHLECHLGTDSEDRAAGDDLRCRMNPTRDGLLVYRGHHPLPERAKRPARWRMSLEQPLVVTGPKTAQAPRALDEPLTTTVEALDFRAIVGGRTTRLVARADLDQPFEAEVLTTEDVLLPEVIPAGTIPALPWELAVEPAGLEHGDAPVRGEEPSRRRWLLKGRPREDGQGRWRDVVWEDHPPSLGFGLGSFDASRAPRVTRIENRRASVGWRMEASDEGGSLCLSVPHWVPVGCPRQVALPPHDEGRDGGFDYGAEVRATLGGLEERFVIDQRSEIPSNRLFLGPRRWCFRDQRHGLTSGVEALGAGAGCVRWRCSAVAGESSGREISPTGRTAASDGKPLSREISPTDWTAGSAPVLLVRKEGDSPLHWGSLYSPRAVPWDALEEVTPEPTADPEELLLVPRSPASPRRGANGRSGKAAAIWIDLWGFICRYDSHAIAFRRGHGEADELTAWVAGTGLELFPRRSGHLLRSFSPVYAVRDPQPRVLELRPTVPRPTLHVGRELDAGGDSLVLEIGGETFVRHQLAEPGEAPAAFEPGRVPGTRLRLDRVGRQVVWLAVEQRHGGRGRRAGYLLSWDVAGGWLLRGFFAHRDAAVELGRVRQRDQGRRLLLGGEGASRASAFRLTIDAEGDHWNDQTPEQVTRRITPELIEEWETHHFAPERRPLLLRDYGMRILQQSAGDEPWIFEFFDGGSKAEAGPPAGIRIWALPGEAERPRWRASGATWLTDDARALGDDPSEEPTTAQNLPATPTKRILRADDDDDF